jgi:hypothetical protein
MPKHIGSSHSHDIKPSLLDGHDNDHEDDIKPTTSPSPSPSPTKRLNPSSSSSASAASPTKKPKPKASSKPNPNTANRLSADHKRTLMEMAMDKFLECADYDDMARKVGACVFLGFLRFFLLE